jgi:hypothetical protein
MDWKNYKPMPLTEDEIYELRNCLHKGYNSLWYDRKEEDDEKEEIKDECQVI